MITLIIVIIIIITHSSLYVTYSCLIMYTCRGGELGAHRPLPLPRGAPARHGQLRRGVRKGTNGVSTDGVTGNFMFF